MKARKKGGQVKPGIPGMDVMKEAAAPAHGFKSGGATKLKSGGVAEGFKSGGRLDKSARTGATNRGRSPYSSAKNMTSPKGMKDR